MGLVVLFSVIVYLCLAFADACKCGSLTNHSKRFAIEGNDLTYYDYGAKYQRDLRSGRLAWCECCFFITEDQWPEELRKIHPKLRPTIEYVVTKPDLFGNQQIIRARYSGGGDKFHQKEIHSEDFKRMVPYLAKYVTQPF